MPPQPWQTPVFKARIWGSRDLRAWYPELPPRPDTVEPIGEAWLSPPDCPVLVKMLFPAQRLSVQVHPDDAYAQLHALGRGKSEAWYVVESSPDALLGVGLRADADLAQLAAACRAGRGADLLRWIPVSPGDVLNIPAGTVHAIGGGVVLLEVQQPSDNTFRLDDYGRGRELHLEHGLAVARSTGGGKIAHGLAPTQSGLLLATEFFSLRRHCLGSRPEPWELPPLDALRWMVNISSPGVASPSAPAPLPPRGHLLPVPPAAILRVHGPATLLEIRSGTA